jgi:hypothetical protein
MAGLHKIHNYDLNKHFKFCIGTLDDCLFLPCHGKQLCILTGIAAALLFLFTRKFYKYYSFLPVFCWKFVVGLLPRVHEND